jgi:hypothetical protein
MESLMMDICATCLGKCSNVAEEISKLEMQISGMIRRKIGSCQDWSISKTPISSGYVEDYVVWEKVHWSRSTGTGQGDGASLKKIVMTDKLYCSRVVAKNETRKIFHLSE